MSETTAQKETLFTVYGSLHSGTVFASLRLDHKSSLEQWGKMIGDEILTLLLLNTGNIFGHVLESNSAIIVSIDRFYIWRSKFEENKKTPLTKPWNSSVNFANYHLIAFPVHIKSPLHFTLGIMVNLHWGQDVEASWALLHFDSCPSSSLSMQYALEFGRHLLDLSKNTKVKAIEVPVIHQPTGSNDCGFYPAHFLEIIFQDIDYYIDECFKMFSAKLQHDSDKVKETWDYDGASKLRHNAYNLFKFYMSLSFAIEEDEEQGLWYSKSGPHIKP